MAASEEQRLVRETIRRGSVQLVLRVERPRRAEDYQLNLVALESYRDQLDFGFIAGANIIPHVQELCDMLPVEFAALEAAYAPPPADVRGAAE